MGDPEFILLGDAVWLDFVNTARGRGRSIDRLTDLAAYHRWTKACKLRSDADTADYAVIRRFRSRLTRLAEALEAGQPAPTAVISMVNELLQRAPGRERLTREAGTWRLRFAPEHGAAALVTVAHSAAASLGDPLLHIRRCAGRGCSLFFGDASPAGERRWCAETVCGDGAWVERRRGALR